VSVPAFLTAAAAVDRSVPEHAAAPSFAPATMVDRRLSAMIVTVASASPWIRCFLSFYRVTVSPG